jgi:galactose mutarotase-like enzyme
MVVLENEFLSVKINLMGAELASIVYKSTGQEYIWQGDKDIWAYHAPNLFPIVGSLNNSTLNIEDKTYTLGRHGFARTSSFRRIESAPEHAQFALRFNEETLKVYPYKFEFQVVYHLSGRSLQVAYKVINLDDKDVYFSVGAHPAFNVPLLENESYENYYLEFEKEENLSRYTLNDKGLFSGNTIPVLSGNKLSLTKDMFLEDAIVFKQLESKKITLKNETGTRKVEIDFPKFKSLGLWAKPGASFVCIEPWLGYSDNEGDALDITKKEGIQIVEPGHVFDVDYKITI